MLENRRSLLERDIRMLLIWSVLGLGFLSGCTTPPANEVSSATASNEEIEVSGQVFFVPLEGGFIGLKTKTERYRLINADIPAESLPRELVVQGVLRPAEPGIHMWGQPLEVKQWQPVSTGEPSKEQPRS